MKRDCPIKLNECPAADSPVTNASSEAPDPLLFAGIGWTQFDPYRPMPLGNGEYVQEDCSNITWNAESQAMADFLAWVTAQICGTPIPPPIPGSPPLPAPLTTTNPSPITPGKPTANFVDQPTREFTNDRQFAQVQCPNGAVFEMAVEAGTVIGGPFPEAVGLAWVQYINAYLLAWILDQLYDQRVCIDIPELNDRTEPNVPPVPPPPPGGSPSTIASHQGYCCLGSAPPAGQFTYNISGGSSSAVWEFGAGALPPGTALVQTGPRSAVLSGTPSAAGSFSFTITATSGSTSITVNDTLNVFGLVSDTLPNATVGTAYSEQLQASGGTAPYTFGLASGTLPTGLTLASDGTISGNPSTNGTFNFSVTITDAVGAHCSSDLSIAAAPAPTCTLIDWTSTLWGVPIEVIGGPGGGTANFYSPISAAGINIHAACTTVGGPDTYSNSAFNEGVLTIKTDAATGCTLRMTVASVNNVFLGTHQAIVSIWLGSPPTLLIASHDVGTLADGTYTFGFTLPNTVCANQAITVRASTVIFGAVVAATSSIDLVATITTP